MDEDEMHEAYEKAIEVDLKNLNMAMNSLIDSVSKFKSVGTTEELTDEDFADMLFALDQARFIVSGVMYLHGKPLCGHDHDEEDED